MAGKETKEIRCPFCGAPYRRPISSDVMQLKCDYCGAMYRVPPQIGVDIPQCANHCDRFAVGMCDDCGRNFCRECLQLFDLNTRGASATLHLCPDCLRKREVDKANTYIYMGIFVLMFAVFGIVVSPLVGVVILILGIVEIAYGASSRPKREADEGEVGESETPAKEEEATFAIPKDLSQPDVMYDELLNKYTERFGLPGGPKILDDEIRAYTWHGDTFEQAVTKVYKSQQNRL